jgi:hypothetical protein
MALYSIGFVILKKKLGNYCLIESVIKGKNPSKLKQIGAAFVTFHPMLNAYFIKDMTPSKRVRLGISFCRNLMMLAVVSIMGSNSGLTTSDSSRLLSEITLSLDVYILLIPYITFVPAEAVMRGLFSPSPKKDGKPEAKKSKRKTAHCIGAAIMVSLIAVSMFVIISIGEASNGQENLKLMGLFARTLAQDWLVTPLLIMILMWVLQSPNYTKLVIH